MVKLAEPRQRNRYTLVPRGKALYEDDERFGTKMLEKMGWSKGKGLGAHEDGSKDFVRIRYKNDAQGLGFGERDDQWTQHEQSFNGLLQSLNGGSNNDNTENNDEDSDVDMRPVGFGFAQTTTTIVKEKPISFKAIISGESLEEKSKNSRARVHYKKFTRGKDLTQYSEKDLANIFGKKALEQISNNETTNADNHVNSNNGNVQETHSHFQSSTLSIADYFKAKSEMLDKQKQQKNIVETFVTDDSQVLKQEEPAEDRKDNKKRKRVAELVEEIKDVKPLETLIKQKKKKQKKNKAEEEVNEEKICQNNDQEQTIKKKRKSKKSKNNVEPQNEEEPLKKIETQNVEKDAKNCHEKTYSNAEIKKERKKKKTKHEIMIELPELTTTHEKKLKKRKIKDALEPIEETSSVKPKCETNNNDNLNEERIAAHSNIKPKDDESMTIKDIENALEAEKVYKLSCFAAEQFRFTDISGFSGSNLNDIKGYGIDDDIKLEIVEDKYDAARISQLWSCTLDKYQYLTRPYDSFREYEKKALEARKNKEKLPRYKAHQYRRKDAFKTVTI